MGTRTNAQGSGELDGSRNSYSMYFRNPIPRVAVIAP